MATGYGLAGGANDRIGRVASLSDSGGVLERYDHLGLGTIVGRTRPQPGVALTYFGAGGEVGDAAGDRYVGLDRFGRVEDQRWATGGGDLARIGHGYDRAGNRTHRDDRVAAGQDEAYAYDGLDRLVGVQKGAWTGTGITAGTGRRSWDYDAVGNWQGVDLDGDGAIGASERQSHDVPHAAADGAVRPSWRPRYRAATPTGCRHCPWRDAAPPSADTASPMPPPTAGTGGSPR